MVCKKYDLEGEEFHVKSAKALHQVSQTFFIFQKYVLPLIIKKSLPKLEDIRMRRSRVIDVFVKVNFPKYGVVRSRIGKLI
uniref:Uncharacterized protein n=1 Tax=Lepeophtheirus salmonis TaxID=72036 RepID=A0A0K2V109_LEPSM